VTAYDYPTAIAADNSGADAILVGDSLGMVALGMDSTIPVTMDVMVHHTAAVRRGTKRAFLVADMPFLSYGVSVKSSVLNAGRLVQEAGAEAVKLEGGAAMTDTIRAICDVGIPVLAHLGLLPQSVNMLGGYRVQGRDEQQAEQILRDALAVQQAGAFAVVLEAMPADLARRISEELDIATIGIGAGKYCDGQVLVISDVVGMLPGRIPKFVKKYADLGAEMSRAIEQFNSDVREGRFPEEAHEY
jgi:3-methyl-2-oxobutanoate hydroxymethyltransferase